MTSIRNDGNLLFKAKLLNSCFSGEKNQSREMNNYLTHKYNKKKKTYQMLNLEFKKWIYVILDLETTVPSDFIKCLYTRIVGELLIVPPASQPPSAGFMKYCINNLLSPQSTWGHDCATTLHAFR